MQFLDGHLLRAILFGLGACEGKLIVLQDFLESLLGGGQLCLLCAFEFGLRSGKALLSLLQVCLRSDTLVGKGNLLRTLQLALCGREALLCPQDDGLLFAFQLGLASGKGLLTGLQSCLLLTVQLALRSREILLCLLQIRLRLDTLVGQHDLLCTLQVCLGCLELLLRALDVFLCSDLHAGDGGLLLTAKGRFAGSKGLLAGLHLLLLNAVEV